VARRPSRKNNALTFFVNGRRAKSLHGITDAAGDVLSRYDVAVTRAVVGLKRRASPAASRAVRAHYGVRAGALTGRFKTEDMTRGRGADKDDAISLWASTRRLPLLDFGGRWSGRRSPGATAEIERGRRTTYDSAFRATVLGKDAIRVREFESSRGRRAPRGPLQMLRGPSPFEMVSNVSGTRPSARVRESVLAELTTFYIAELRRQFALSRS
jgi:hypothetical protein